jgi:hypothetical protein
MTKLPHTETHVEFRADKAYTVTVLPEAAPPKGRSAKSRYKMVDVRDSTYAPPKTKQRNRKHSDKAQYRRNARRFIAKHRLTGCTNCKQMATEWGWFGLSRNKRPVIFCQLCSEKRKAV